MRQAVGDFVEIALVGTKNVLGDRQSPRLVEAARQHRDVGVVAALVWIRFGMTKCVGAARNPKLSLPTHPDCCKITLPLPHHLWTNHA